MILNPHLGTAQFPTHTVPRVLETVSGARLWSMRGEANASYWRRSTLSAPFGRRGWPMCSESEIPAFLAAYAAGTPSLFNFNEKTGSAGVDSHAANYLASGWTPSGLGDLGAASGGFAPNQGAVNAYYGAFKHWLLRAGGAATSGYESRLAATLIAYINNASNDALTQGSNADAGIYIFHGSGPNGLLLMIQCWCLQDLIEGGYLTLAQGIAVQDRLRRFAWRCALDCSWWVGKYDFGNAGTKENWTNGDYSVLGSAVTGINTGEGGDTRIAYHVKNAAGDRISPVRYIHGSDHVGGNQLVMPMHYVVLAGLMLDCEPLVTEWKRHIASAIAYQQTREGYGWDMFRLTTQDAMTNGSNPGGGGYHFEIGVMIVSPILLMNRLGRTDSPLNWEFDTGLPAVTGTASSGASVPGVPSTIPVSGVTKKLTDVWDFHRDAVGGLLTDVFACDGSTNAPAQNMRWPARRLPMRASDGDSGRQWDAQFICMLMMYAHARIGQSYDKPIRRIAPYNVGPNASNGYWEVGTGKALNHAWAPGFALSQSPVFPVPGIQMREMFLTGTPAFEGTQTGVNLFTSTPAVGTQNKILSVTNTPGSLAWSIQVETISGGEIRLFNPTAGAQDPFTPVSVASGVRVVSPTGPDGIWKAQLWVGGVKVDESAEFTLSPAFLALRAPRMTSTTVELDADSFAHPTVSATLQEVTITETPTGGFAQTFPSIVPDGPPQTVQHPNAAVVIAAAGIAGKRVRWIANSGGEDAIGPSAIVAAAPVPTPPPPPPPPAAYTWTVTGFTQTAPSSTITAAGTTNSPSVTAVAKSAADPTNTVTLTGTIVSGLWYASGAVPDGLWDVYVTTADAVAHFAGRTAAYASSWATWQQNLSESAPRLVGTIYGYPAVTATLLAVDGDPVIEMYVQSVVGAQNQVRTVQFSPLLTPTYDVYRFATTNAGDQPGLPTFTWGTAPAPSPPPPPPPPPGVPPPPPPAVVAKDWLPQALWTNPDQTLDVSIKDVMDAQGIVPDAPPLVEPAPAPAPAPSPDPTPPDDMPTLVYIMDSGTQRPLDVTDLFHAGQLVNVAGAVTANQPPAPAKVKYAPANVPLSAGVATQVVTPAPSRTRLLIMARASAPVYFGYGNYPTLTDMTAQEMPIPPWDPARGPNAIDMHDQDATYEVWAWCSVPTVLVVAEERKA